jgi:hypothetical protein
MAAARGPAARSGAGGAGRRQAAGLSPGEIVFHEGDHGRTIHLVAGGHFGLRVTSARGQDCTLRV